MLNDAVAAEAYKLLRNRSTLFWGFFFAPLVVLAFHLGLDTYLKLNLRLSLNPDMGREILQALGLGGSSFVQILFVTGAAGIFAGEYRWETWRLLTPRNSRVNLLAAKFIVYAIASAVSLMTFAAAASLHVLYGALLNRAWPSPPQAGFFDAALGVFLATWAELLVLGIFTGLVAVASRAMIGAVLAGIFFSFAQSIAMALAHPWDAPLRYFALLPSMSAYLLRAWASGQEIAPGVLADPAKVLPAACFLAAWIAAVGGAALVLFQRQDLPRE